MVAVVSQPDRPRGRGRRVHPSPVSERALEANLPLLRPNLTEFWRAWHMSLSSWARDYIYFPLLGKYRSTSLALLATMLMIGTWHSPAPGWALWGLHHGVGLVLLSIFHRWAQRRATVQ